MKIVRGLPQKNVLFIPDMNLGHYVALQVPEKNVILNDGFCPTHEAIELAEIEAARAEHPGARVLAHPECGDWVLKKADFVGSTSQIIAEAVASDASDFIIATVHGVIHELERQTEGSGKHFWFPKTCPICPNMARVTADKVLACLRDGSGEVGLPDEGVVSGSTRALDLMLEYAK